MKFLIDTHLSEDTLTGIGRYINELVTGLFKILNHNDLSLITNGYNVYNFNTIHLNKRCTCFPVYLHGLSIRQHIILPKIIHKIRPDVYHHPHFDLPFFQSVPSVITIHDLKYIRHPEFFSDLNLIKSLYMKSMMASSIKRAKRIIAVSKSTKHDIISTFNCDEKKINVIYHGRFNYHTKAIKEFDLCKLGITKPYILCVGERRPHKNIPNLIKAFIELNKHYKPDIQLVIVGKAYASYCEPEKIVQKNGLCDSVILTGYITDDLLDYLYKNAYLFVIPSLYEGFGFPILEAMNAGVPVVGSDRTSIPEIIGEAGLLFSPVDIDDMVNKIKLALTNKELRNRLKDLGLKRAGQFTWERTAKATMEVYQDVIESSKRSDP
jgi:glycosyltransferase involved in cell wall biosynthesis